MEWIYQIIKANPDYFAWVFGLVNLLWVAFVYFNKKSHDQNMAKLSHSLDKRRRVFEMRLEQYEAYVEQLDKFFRKNHVDLPRRMQPIFDKFNEDYLNSSSANDEVGVNRSLVWLGSQTSEVLRESLEDYLIVNSASNKLKLSATDEMLSEFEDLEVLLKKAFDMASEFVTRYVQVITENDQESIDNHTNESKRIGILIEEKSKRLMQLMRDEICQI